ncbi:hypothetical protein GCM10029992_03340 [Glycomyces albus]
MVDRLGLHLQHSRREQVEQRAGGQTERERGRDQGDQSAISVRVAPATPSTAGAGGPWLTCLSILSK